MNECERARALVDRWEEGVSLSSEESSFLSGHLSACETCGREFGALLPFLVRDEGRARLKPSKTALSIADAVMASVMEEGSPKIRSFRANRPRRWVLPLAAAAAAVLALLVVAPRAFQRSDTVVVRFVVSEPSASSVSLAGDFTGWKTKGYAMHLDPAGRVWEIDVPLQKGKVYLYNFVIDGTKWAVDPHAIEKIDDGFGGSSALLRL